MRARRASWEQLESLLERTDRGGVSVLSRIELQDLGRLYRSTSADLSRARALRLGAETELYLNNLVVRAHNQVYQTDRNRWRQLFAFLSTGFPALLRENIVYFLISFSIFLLPAGMSYLAVKEDPRFAQLELMRGQPLIPEDMWNMIEHKKMWTDYAQNKSPAVFSLIATNNIRVSILAFIGGITFGIGTVWVLFTNGLHLGTVFGACEIHGMAQRLALFVAPHGVLELTAIFISGAAGLVVGKSMLYPGRFSRADSFKRACAKAAGLFAGTVPLLLVAGCIEGFISPRTDISPDLKLVVSLATLIFLVVYLFVPRSGAK